MKKFQSTNDGTSGKTIYEKKNVIKIQNKMHILFNFSHEKQKCKSAEPHIRFIGCFDLVNDCVYFGKEFSKTTNLSVFSCKSQEWNLLPQDCNISVDEYKYKLSMLENAIDERFDKKKENFDTLLQDRLDNKIDNKEILKIDLKIKEEEQKKVKARIEKNKQFLEDVEDMPSVRMFPYNLRNENNYVAISFIQDKSVKMEHAFQVFGCFKEKDDGIEYVKGIMKNYKKLNIHLVSMYKWIPINVSFEKDFSNKYNIPHTYHHEELNKMVQATNQKIKKDRELFREFEKHMTEDELKNIITDVLPEDVEISTPLPTTTPPTTPLDDSNEDNDIPTL